MSALLSFIHFGEKNSEREFYCWRDAQSLDYNGGGGESSQVTAPSQLTFEKHKMEHMSLNVKMLFVEVQHFLAVVSSYLQSVLSEPYSNSNYLSVVDVGLDTFLCKIQMLSYLWSFFSFCLFKEGINVSRQHYHLIRVTPLLTWGEQLSFFCYP